MHEIQNKIPQLRLKHAFDRVGAVILILLLTPLGSSIVFAMFVESILNSNARGPVIVFEERMSRGRPFMMYKFRSHVVDAPSRDYTQGTRLYINSKKMTIVGTFLRKFYLDEFPQLINIFRGEMSFVGPRPLPRPENHWFVERGGRSRILLRGGLCGSAQAMKGKFDSSTEESLLDEKLLDMYENSTAIGALWVDLIFLIKTARTVFRGEGL